MSNLPSWYLRGLEAINSRYTSSSSNDSSSRYNDQTTESSVSRNTSSRSSSGSMAANGLSAMFGVPSWAQNITNIRFTGASGGRSANRFRETNRFDQGGFEVGNFERDTGLLNDGNNFNDNTQITGTAANDNLDGNDGGSDRISGMGGSDNIRGLGGNDRLNGNEGADFINGNQGDDIVRGGRGDDEVRGGAGNDIVTGDLGADRLFGDKGNDIIFLDRQDQSAEGGSGRDIFILERGADRSRLIDFNGAEDVIIDANEMSSQEIMSMLQEAGFNVNDNFIANRFQDLDSGRMNNGF